MALHIADTAPVANAIAATMQEQDFDLKSSTATDAKTHALLFTKGDRTVAFNVIEGKQLVLVHIMEPGHHLSHDEQKALLESWGFKTETVQTKAPYGGTHTTLYVKAPKGQATGPASSSAPVDVEGWDTLTEEEKAAAHEWMGEDGDVPLRNLLKAITLWYYPKNAKMTLRVSKYLISQRQFIQDVCPMATPPALFRPMGTEDGTKLAQVVKAGQKTPFTLTSDALVTGWTTDLKAAVKLAKGREEINLVVKLTGPGAKVVLAPPPKMATWLQKLLVAPMEAARKKAGYSSEYTKRINSKYAIWAKKVKVKLVWRDA